MQRLVESFQTPHEVLLGIPINGLDISDQNFENTNCSVTSEKSVSHTSFGRCCSSTLESCIIRHILSHKIQETAQYIERIRFQPILEIGWEIPPNFLDIF